MDGIVRNWWTISPDCAIAFETGFYWSNIYDADLFLKPATSTLDKWNLRGGLNSFEVMMIKSSMGLLIVDGFMVVPSFFELDFEYPNRIHRERVLFTLNELKTIPSYPGPKFVFAHIISPHYPFVFTEDGTPVIDPEVNDKDAPLNERKTAYREQITYINAELIDILNEIIGESKIAPIIIIQGDHGPRENYSEEYIRHRMNILNAYFIPENLYSNSLYPHISPVNSFRIVFNSLINADFALLEDSSFYSIYQQPYSYMLVENECSEVAE